MLFNANTTLLEEKQWYYLTHSWEDKWVFDIYTPGKKHKTTLKNEEKDIVHNF